MQAKRDDDLKDSFYLHIMRSSIGAGLRNQYAPNQHMPHRLAELLRELDGPKGEAEAVEKEQNPRSMRKQPRKK